MWWLWYFCTDAAVKLIFTSSERSIIFYIQMVWHVAMPIGYRFQYGQTFGQLTKSMLDLSSTRKKIDTEGWIMELSMDPSSCSDLQHSGEISQESKISLGLKETAAWRTFMEGFFSFWCMQLCDIHTAIRYLIRYAVIYGNFIYFTVFFFIFGKKTPTKKNKYMSPPNDRYTET